MKRLFILTIFAMCINAHAFPLIDSHMVTFELKHGAQGTGNYKSKRDRHEKPGPQNEKKKNSSKWLRLKK